MITLHHAVKISSPRERVYKALTDINEMTEWHQGEVLGEVRTGEILRLCPEAGKVFSWEITFLEENALIQMNSDIDATDSRPPKTLSFKLSDLSNSQTLVELWHGEWPENDRHLPFCNTHWGRALFDLKYFVENN
ncbi:SRPBCC domain-containing protein [Erwinia amylovora]